MMPTQVPPLPFASFVIHQPILDEMNRPAMEPLHFYLMQDRWIHCKGKRVFPIDSLSDLIKWVESYEEFLK